MFVDLSRDGDFFVSPDFWFANPGKIPPCCYFLFFPDLPSCAKGQKSRLLPARHSFAGRSPTLVKDSRTGRCFESKDRKGVR